MEFKNLFFAFFILILVGSVSAETQIQTLGTVEKGETINLIQNCLTSTYSNISRIVYPNRTFALNTQTTMTKNGDDYSYSYSDTETQGNYIVYGVCDEEGSGTNWVYDFEVTYNSETLDTPKAILFLGLISILIIIFVINTYFIMKLPTKDTIDEDGNIVSINQLKHLRTILIGIDWGLLLIIAFVTSNVSIAFLQNNMFGNLFFNIYKGMMVLTYPIVLVWFIYLFVSVFQDGKFKKMIERGIDVPSKV